MNSEAIRAASSTTLLYSGAKSLGGAVKAGASSILYLVKVDEATALEEAEAAAALGLASAHVPVEVPSGLSASTAAACLAALQALPGPTLIACASGNRSSAVVALSVGLRNGWSGAEALKWAAEERMPFTAVQALRSWVQVSSAACCAWGKDTRCNVCLTQYLRSSCCFPPPPSPSPSVS
jgi:hypothetical protein